MLIYWNDAIQEMYDTEIYPCKINISDIGGKRKKLNASK